MEHLGYEMGFSCYQFECKYGVWNFILVNGKASHISSGLCEWSHNFVWISAGSKHEPAGSKQVN